MSEAETTKVKYTMEMYLADCEQAQQAHPGWRWGQCLFNVLYMTRNDLSEQIRADYRYDPFHFDNPEDARVVSFMDWLTKNWESGPLYE